MGRELRRKQAKKDGKSLEKEEIVAKNPIGKLFFNVFLVVGIFSIIYLISALFITKELDWFKKDKNKDTTENNTNSDIILASSIFKQSEEEYYVYFYDFDEEKEDSAITSLITGNLYDSKLYKVNSKSAMNANYFSDGETGNKNAKSLDELKMVSPTLLKINGGTITEYYEKEEIKGKFN